MFGPGAQTFGPVARTFGPSARCISLWNAGSIAGAQRSVGPPLIAGFSLLYCYFSFAIDWLQWSRFWHFCSWRARSSLPRTAPQCTSRRSRQGSSRRPNVRPITSTNQPRSQLSRSVAFYSVLEIDLIKTCSFPSWFFSCRNSTRKQLCRWGKWDSEGEDW